MNKRRLLIGLVFLVGCAVGGASSHLTAPAAHAEPGGARYDYDCFNQSVADIGGAVSKLRQHGDEGWELIGMAGGATIQYCLKRAMNP